MARYRNTEWAQNADSDSENESHEPLWDRWDTYKMATVAVIDNTASMFDPDDVDEDGDTYFKMALKSCLKTLERFIFKSYPHTFAIVLLNKKEYEPIVNFSSNLLESVEKLSSLTKKTNEELKDMFELDDLNNEKYYESLVNVIEIFRKNSKYMKKSKRHVAVITNQANPINCDSSNDDIERAMERLLYFQISFLVLPVIESFEWDIFYKDIINKSIKSENDFINEFDSEGYTDVNSLSEVLDNLCQSRTCIKRATFSFGSNEEKTDINDEGTVDFMYVQVVKFCRPKGLYRNVKIDPRNMTVLVKYNPGENMVDSQESEIDASIAMDFDNDMDFNESTGSIELKSKPNTERTLRMLRKSKDFINTIKKPEIKNYGFKLLYISDQRSTIHYLKKRMFLVQNDEFYNEDNTEDDLESEKEENEEQFFDYFWNYCVENNKVLICTYMRDRKQRHHLIELRPDRYNGKLCFLAQYLASADGTKKFAPYAKKIQSASEKGKDVSTAMEVIEKLTVKNPKRPFQIVNMIYVKKCNMISGLLFPTKEWAPPEILPFWPEREDITKKIGYDLTDKFKREYLSEIHKRKRPVKRAPARKK